ncbi:MAG: hypothetical protein JW729_11235, partial [Bacteroidales bacterium]|nr:hypothetical protein [Bacteroidales bacterium]
EIGAVELTFFSSFPNFELKITDFTLINPTSGSTNDTLLKLASLNAIVDAKSWWKKKEFILRGLELKNGSVFIFSDSLGNTNYDITPADTISSSETDGETALPFIDLQNIELNNVNLSYQDESLKLNTVIQKIHAQIAGTFYQDRINASLSLSNSIVSLMYENEKYLQEASIQFNIPLDYIPSTQFLTLDEATASVNDLQIMLNGSIESDSLFENISTNLAYQFSSWPFKNIQALLPPSYDSYFEKLDIEGLISSEGKIHGVYNNSSMPLMNIHLLLEKGMLKSTDFPLHLHDIFGDLTIYSDLNTDSISFVQINQFEAKTPQSTFSTKGLINHLFSDTYCNLTSNAKLQLDEFNPLIPDSLKMSVSGKANGNIQSVFTLSQLEKIELEKIKLSGLVNLTDFSFSYDSIALQTNQSKINFSLPNQKATSKETRFAFVSFDIQNLEASKLNSYATTLRNAFISVETSDARDTDKIPHLTCSFALESLSAELDTLSLALSKPNGKIALSPRTDRLDQFQIQLSYSSEEWNSSIGPNTMQIKNIHLDTELLNDNTQEDVFLQWVAKGFLDINQGNIAIAGYTHPIQIPSVKMDFEPEHLNIKEAQIAIDRSDFELKGNLNNVLSYFRGDSLLRGNFNFNSNKTDLAQLMALTNGIGNEEQDEISSDSSYSGPYMVPKGIDLLLKANIKTATMGKDSATNIRGNVQVKNGILLLDELKFKTPAARMQLTALYRTPRKNHLFLGIDYHMMDVEIGELLTMIPDIDSLMPMLRSFGGKGEFHFAGETYLDSLYNMKKSTLRGASSIKGNNLVLMDGETFSEIAKTLNFSKKTINIVDSLSAEFTIFRDEIDVYPFLLVMDKYKAVVAGRHNFDLSFNYHISVVDSPLPIKLGVDVNGTIDDLSYKLTKCRYAEFYRPSARRVVENQQLALRKMIRTALMEKVKE